MSTFDVSFRRLLADWRRALAMLSLVLLAVTSFVVLTGTAERSRLEVVGTTSSATSAYDVLVRPPGSRSAAEKRSGLVRPNYLSGIFGGITRRQVDSIRDLPGVEVAAPIAMVGMVMQSQEVPLDVTRWVRSDQASAVRFTTRQAFARGQGSVPGPSGFLYAGKAVGMLGSDSPSDVGGIGDKIAGKDRLICASPQGDDALEMSPHSAKARFDSQCWNLSTGSAGVEWPSGEGRFVIRLKVISPVMVAAVDPVAENKLVGLGRASIGALDATDRPSTDEPVPGERAVSVPVIAASRSSDDLTTTVRVDQLPKSAVTALQQGGSFAKAYSAVSKASGRTVLKKTITANRAYRTWVDSADSGFTPRMFFRPSPVEYTQHDAGHLVPKAVPDDPSVWQTGAFVNELFTPLPATSSNTGYRRISSFVARGGAPVRLTIKGTYDASRLTEQSSLARVPLETYAPPQATGADRTTRSTLHGKSLKPDGNPRGYLQNPPMLLTTMRSLPAFASAKNYMQPQDNSLATKPVSAVRVRVSDADIGNPAGRERIRLVAEEIQRRTGLVVDVTAGSSPAPTTIALPKSALGTPAMLLNEPWSKKGVAALVTQAINKKSLMLFILILAVTGLAVATSANAAIRARRVELGVLSCIGWRRATIMREVLTELTMIGLAAGAIGASAAVPIGAAMNAPVAWTRALLAIPVALLLALVAGIWPALRAASVSPIEAVRPSATDATKAHRIPLRGIPSMALTYLARTPGRVMIAALSLALGVSSLAILLGIVRGFSGSVVGTVLGDAISVQVQGSDLAAAALLGVIGIAGLADVIYLDIREQAPRYAALRATGWRDSTLARLIAWQAAAIGVIGAVLGAVLALACLTFLGALTTTTAISTVAIAIAAIAAAVLTSLIPASAMRRLPMARLLAQD